MIVLDRFNGVLLKLIHSVSFFAHHRPPVSVMTPQSPRRIGEVLLVGAGCGDADLLTLKAYKALQTADVVMYDWLVNPDILELIPSQVERVFVGKKCAQHSMQQGDICKLMVQYAKWGKRIVRLKGGDPAIFARAGEECDELAKHNIPFVIVPGITAASGASAYAGIPLTHRDCAQSVRFITAHLKSEDSEPDWDNIVAKEHASQGETLVFYMGLRRLEKIMLRLLEHGMNNSMPVAVIDKATSSQQQVCCGTVENIANLVEPLNFTGPSLIIIGEVVNKRHHISAELQEQTSRHFQQHAN